MAPGNRVAIIPARGNSKGIPRKNLLPIGGRPLLSYSVAAARASDSFDCVVVSSESPDVLSYAGLLGATPSERPIHLAGDDVHSVHVVLDLIERWALAPETLVCMLLPTSPLRTEDDVRGAMQAFEAHDVDSVVSVYRDPKHLMQLRRIDGDGLLQPLLPGDPNVQRQDMEEHYVVNGSIYVSTAGTLARLGSFHRGRVLPFIMDRDRSVDIDTLDDVSAVERMLSA